jgi:hypothetical protein
LSGALALTLGKARNSSCSEFPAFAECQGQGTRQRFFLKNFAGCRPDRALGKENTKKVKNSLSGVATVQHPANKLYKKRKIFAGCLADTALGKENTKKKLFAGCPRCAAPGKENLKKNLCRAPLT